MQTLTNANGQTVTQIMREHLQKAEYKSFNFNTYEGAVRDAITQSIKYGTFWHVRLLDDGYYSYAHSSDDEKTVACFYNGQDWTNI